MWPINLAWLVFIGWVIIYANEWEDYSNYLGERAEVSRIWATTHFLTLMVGLGTVMAPGVCHLAYCCVTVSIY